MIDPDDDFDNPADWPAVVLFLLILALLAIGLVRTISYLNESPPVTTTTTEATR